MTFLNRGRPIFGGIGRPATAATGLPVAAPAPGGVTDDLSASQRINALAFNAVTRALSEADVFVRLTDRQRIAAAVLEAIQDEHEQQVREEIAARIERMVVLARRSQSPVDAKADAYAVAAMIARGDR